MKSILKYLAATAGFIAAFAFNSELLKRLDLSEQEAKEAIRDNFIRGGLWFPGNQTIKALAVTKRAATVKELGSYIRQYIESPEFNKAYQEARAAAKPAGKGDAQTLINERLAAIEEELTEAEEKLKAATGDRRKLHELSVSQLKQERDALKNPSHPMHNDYVENLTEETEENAAQRKMEADHFANDYPSTVKELVRLRLQKFLDVTATINFNAKLVQQGNIKVFADPALEAKDSDWKKLFRAGPETIGAARQFAQAWLRDLSK
jgi:hypothetical protein